jgi:hypothetical protein
MATTAPLPLLRSHLHCLSAEADAPPLHAAMEVRRIDPELLDDLRNEIELLKMMDHPNVIKLYEYYEDEVNIYLILEFCDGGELFDRLHAQKGSRYTEAEAGRLMFKMCAAIGYCHYMGISHRYVAVPRRSTVAAGVLAGADGTHAPYCAHSPYMRRPVPSRCRRCLPAAGTSSWRTLFSSRRSWTATSS